MFHVISGRKILDYLLLLCILFASFVLIDTAKQLSTVNASIQGKAASLVIDPGHGGIDGGAVAYNGIKESSINLAIGLKLQDLSELYGIRTVMTRTDDSSRSDIESYSEHEDLVRRAELVNTASNPCLISIHQNFYPTSQPSGAQVLYAANEKSQRFGELTHNLLVKSLQPGNRRVAEPAPRSLYITSHVNCAAILVECGFLSNLNDLDRLSQDKYQTSLAGVLLASYLQFHSGNLYT